MGRSAGDPESQEENWRVFEESREESLRLRETEITLRFRKAREHDGGEPDTVISEYSVFHEVLAPRTYGGK